MCSAKETDGRFSVGFVVLYVEDMTAVGIFWVKMSSTRGKYHLPNTSIENADYDLGP